MKKTTIAIALALVIGIGFAASNSFAWNQGGGHGGNHNGNYSMHNGEHMGYGSSTYDSPEYKKFLQDTQKLRAEIMADRVELQAIMNGQNPDAKRARILSGEINDKELQLAEIARKSNIQGGSYNYGNGWACGISGHNHGFGSCW